VSGAQSFTILATKGGVELRREGWGAPKEFFGRETVWRANRTRPNKVTSWQELKGPRRVSRVKFLPAVTARLLQISRVKLALEPFPDAGGLTEKHLHTCGSPQREPAIATARVSAQTRTERAIEPVAQPTRLGQ
jgi:hypothetical protein